jgi:hypothetical protein
VRKTFSMSRWAITLPEVARRSPAITTPPAKTSATMVVPWVNSWPPSTGVGTSPDRRPGSRCGTWAVTKSVNEDGPGAR